MDVILYRNQNLANARARNDRVRGLSYHYKLSTAEANRVNHCATDTRVFRSGMSFHGGSNATNRSGQE